jgi:hypothetical protein
MTRIMRDSDTPSAIPIDGTDLVAGYVSGTPTWPPGAFDRFHGIPHAHIDTLATVPEQAEILDVEPNCATVPQAVTWVRKRNAAFPGAYPPVVYCDRGTLTPLFNAMHAAGLRVVRDFRLWVTTLDGTKKLPDMTGVIAVQHKRAPNKLPDGSLERPNFMITAGHYDESIVYDDEWDPGDDLPYTKKQILDLVQQGVAAELSAGRSKAEILALVKQGAAAELSTMIGPAGVSAAQGAQAAVHADTALAGIAKQLTALAAQVAALRERGGASPGRPA